MRLTHLADYAVVMMTAAARRPAAARACRRPSWPTRPGVPLPTAQKLMQRLAAHGLLTGTRGAGGGYLLARPVTAISLADIVEGGRRADRDDPMFGIRRAERLRIWMRIAGFKPHMVDRRRGRSGCIEFGEFAATLCSGEGRSRCAEMMERPQFPRSCLRRSTALMTDDIAADAPTPNSARRSPRIMSGGFSSDIETDFAPKGLSEDTVRFISAKKNEPQWMLDWRLKAYRPGLRWRRSTGQARHPADRLPGRLLLRPRPRPNPSSVHWTRSIPEILRVYEKLGIPIEEQKVLAGVEGGRKVAVDAVFDSVSVATTFRRGIAPRRGDLCRSRKRSTISRLYQKVPRVGGSAARQSVRLPECRGLLRRDVRLCARGRPLPRWNCQLTSASMPKIPASSSGP